MHPLKQLQDILSTRKPVSSGKVVAVSPTGISVALKSGVTVLPRTDATVYNVGDTAVIRNGVLAGKRVDENTLPVFVL